MKGRRRKAFLLWHASGRRGPQHGGVVTPSSTRPRSPFHLESRVSSAEPSPLPRDASTAARPLTVGSASSEDAPVSCARLSWQTVPPRDTDSSCCRTPGRGRGPCLVLTLPLTWPGAEAEARHPGGPWRGRPALGRPVLSLGAGPGSLPRPPPARLSTRGPWPRAECRAHRGHHAALSGAPCRPGPSASRHLPCSRGGASHRCLFSSAACVPGGVTALRVKPGVGGG